MQSLSSNATDHMRINIRSMKRVLIRDFLKRYKCNREEAARVHSKEKNSGRNKYKGLQLLDYTMRGLTTI